MQLYVQINGGKEFANALKSSDDYIKRQLADTLNNTAVGFSRKAWGYAPYWHGQLRSSITNGITNAKPTDNPMYAAVGSNLRYAVYQEFGTGVYAGQGPIRPKRAKFLRFKTKSGKWVTTRQVKGTKPKKFMQKARDEILPQFEGDLKQTLANITNYLATN